MQPILTIGESASDTLLQALKKNEHCLNQLTIEQIWWRPEPSMNSVGNLVLHLAGNLRQWGIVPFTNLDDQRDRDREFQSDPRLDAETLWKLLSQTVDEAKQTWQMAEASSLQQVVEIQGFQVSLLHAIMHTTCHFVGHTHQIIQLCRIQLGESYQFHWTPDDDRSSVPI